MVWFIIVLGIVALGLFSKALIKKSRGSSQTGNLKTVNDASKAAKADLFKLQFIEHAEKYGEKTYLQFEELEKKYNAYLQTLGQKFNPSEVTYDRYLNPVQLVKETLTENFKKLKDVVIFIGNNVDIVTELSKNTNATLTPEEKGKVDIHKKYLTYFDELYSINQKALNELDNLTLSLSQVSSTQTDPKQIEYLVKELNVLADRAKKYNLT